jgi:hypothetical protein
MLKYLRRNSRRRRRTCLNAGFAYGAFAALLFVVVKSLKYTNGGRREDLPWAILIILAAGLICGFLWQLVRAMFEPQRKRMEDSPPSEDNES